MEAMITFNKDDGYTEAVVRGFKTQGSGMHTHTHTHTQTHTQTHTHTHTHILQILKGQKLRSAQN